MQTTKRVYEKPTILKVQLNHEQAVLGICSSGVTNLSTSGQVCRNQCPACRRTSQSPPCPSADDSATS